MRRKSSAIQKQGRRRRFSIRFLIFLILIASLVPVAAIGWKELYVGFLETDEPVIRLIDPPRGIGITPVSFTIELTDELSGLDEIVVRAKQKKLSKELFRKRLQGNKRIRLPIEIPGKKSVFNEGVGYLEIRAFDRSNT